MSDERKPLWPWIVVLLIGLPVLYVASFGPACWVTASHPTLIMPAGYFYWPLTRAAWAYPNEKAVEALWRYGAPKDDV
jgi:hypothetical protein